jgi:3-hydroxyacyl-[acyl-carrier-protein] dehydratase
MGRFVVAADHPSLPGHFPGRPIVPGVVLLDEALALIRAHHGGALSALRVKFIAIVQAGEAIDVVATSSAAGLSFAGLRDGQSVMSGSLRLDSGE